MYILQLFTPLPPGGGMESKLVKKIIRVKGEWKEGGREGKREREWKGKGTEYRGEGN